MSRVHLLARSSQVKNGLFRTLQRACLSSSSSSSSDDEANKHKKLMEKRKSKEALEKLNKLLLTMTGEVPVSQPKLDLAQPINRRFKKREKSPNPKPKSPETQIIEAARSVAESIGGDVKQTQSELLTKLLNVSAERDASSATLNDIVKGMKVDQEAPKTKAQQVKAIRPRVPKARIDSVVERIDLFKSDPLGIFDHKENYTEGVENETWNYLHRRELKLAVTHPPSNYFQQMILWTEQGKVWKFPIDNEQGLEDEKQVPFTEHVFLEKHLEPWCPPRGPLRHFMELVCVGLSKNPYLTVSAKREHINWFRNYFEDKKQLLKETGVIQEESPSQKHIE